jgi:hypothetical protein
VPCRCQAGIHAFPDQVALKFSQASNAVAGLRHEVVDPPHLCAFEPQDIDAFVDINEPSKQLAANTLAIAFEVTASFLSATAHGPYSCVYESNLVFSLPQLVQSGRREAGA